MSASFRYVTYIRATPERVWAALTDKKLILRYWYGMSCDSEWKPGASWRLTFPDGRIADEGEILEVDPPKKLVIRWLNKFNPAFAEEGPGRCAYLLAAEGGATQLTILHEMDKENSGVIEAVSDGWPRILANLKSLLETGDIALAAPR